MTSHLPMELPSDDELRASRLFHQFYREWYIPNIPKLTVELGVSETTLRNDFVSEKFKKELLSQSILNVHRYKSATNGDGLKESYVSNIRNAAISSENQIDALSATIEEIRTYLSAMKESVMIDSRFRNEAMLVSRHEVPTGKICDSCGAPMQVVDLGMGIYTGCSTWPECRNTGQIKSEEFISLPMRVEFLGYSVLDELLARLQPSGTDWRPFTYNEPATKKEFIDPILRSLGWDTFEGSNVGREEKTGEGQADYVLYTNDGKPFAIVEAKKVGTKLNNWTTQLRRYMSGLQTTVGILTNGFGWDIYEIDDDGRMVNILSIQDIVSNTHDTALTALINHIGRG